MNNEKKIQREMIERANLPKNKFNFPLHQQMEQWVGEPSDRTAEDIGIEREFNNNHE